MAMTQKEIYALLQNAFPEDRIEIQALVQDNEHYAVKIISKKFIGLSRIQQHQMVYSALKGNMGTQLHALSITTSPPKE